MRPVMKKRGIFARVGENLTDSFGYIKESRHYIYFIIWVFLISGLIGFTFSSHFGFIEDLLKQIAEKAIGLNGPDLIMFIFNNNIKSAFLGILLGVFFGIMPFVNALTNGLVLGYVLDKVWHVSGITDLWRILPHGIFELPAIFIALGLGIKLGMFIFSKRKFYELKRRAYESLKVFLFVIVPLLVIAAIIEGLLITFL